MKDPVERPREGTRDLQMESGGTLESGRLESGREDNTPSNTLKEPKKGSCMSVEFLFVLQGKYERDRSKKG